MTEAGAIEEPRSGERIRAFTPGDLAAVVRLWEASLGARYPLRADVLELSLAADPTTVVRAAVAELDGRIDGFAFAGACDAGPPELETLRGRVWLQAVVVAPDRRRRGLGSALARWVVELGRTSVAREVRAGGGLHYLWPGVPDDLPDAGAFLEALGFWFDPHVAFDLRGDVTGLGLDETTERVLATEGSTVVPARAADRDALLAFILAEFGGEWWHDTRYFLDAGGDPADLLLLIDAGRAIRGFVRIHTALSRPLGWPMFWRAGAPDAGGLGPIGVAEALRGRGLGRALLVSALDRLRALGATDVVIDDTTLLGYYGPHGFSPWITYRHAATPIGSLVADPAAPTREDR
jgi:GNAT superfamily N-acetyltransferase